MKHTTVNNLRGVSCLTWLTVKCYFSKISSEIMVIDFVSILTLMFMDYYNVPEINNNFSNCSILTLQFFTCITFGTASS